MSYYISGYISSFLSSSKAIRLVLSLIIVSYCFNALASSDHKVIQPSIEELRVTNAEKQFPKVVNQLNEIGDELKKYWVNANDYQFAIDLVDSTGYRLWQTAKHQLRERQNFDDRPLYWQRLKMSLIIKTLDTKFNISQQQRTSLLARFEKASRGRNDQEFNSDAQKRIFLTGFDPFLLDRNIKQSNPSGVIALLLDGLVIENNGITAEINTQMIPVRYSDFDLGLIEESLAPIFATNNVNMLITVSMGRENFQLERFPGKRRSASTPDNLNIYAGGSLAAPVIPKLNQQYLSGAEFIEFSLPVTQMLKAKGQFAISDNHHVITLKQEFNPQSLQKLTSEIAVEGSGGGYLSNEISYRSIRLRNQLNSTIPIGHIHTPRISEFDANTIQQIVEQITLMLKMTLTEI